MFLPVARAEQIMTAKEAIAVLKEERDHVNHHLGCEGKADEYYEEMRRLSDALGVAISALEIIKGDYEGNKSDHFKPYEGITDEQWDGNASVCAGSIWMTDEGEVQARKFQCWFGGAEIIGSGENSKLVKADIDSDGYNFSLFGTVHPILTVHKRGENGNCYELGRDHPREFERYAKYLRGEAFDSYVGRMFIKRLPELLDYRFDLARILGAKEAAHE